MLSEGCAVSVAVVAQARHIDAARGGDFGGVADVPFFKIQRAHFGVTLKGQGRRAPTESLMQTNLSARQQRGTRRQIEGIAVPMKHEGVLGREMTQRRGQASRGQQQRPPADFFFGAGIDAGAKRAR